MKYIVDLIQEVYDINHTPEQTSSLGILTNIYNPITNNNALITKQEDTVYLAFRSTVMEEKNILQDLLEFPWVHEHTKAGEFDFDFGFHLAWESLKPKVVDFLNTINCKQLIIVGHSLGAAIAGVATIDLLQLGFNVTENYLLACPNFVNKKGIEFINSKVKVNSFLNGADAIWMFALFLKRGPYTRIGKRVWWKWFSFNDHQTWDTKSSQGYITSLKQYFGDKY